MNAPSAPLTAEDPVDLGDLNGSLGFLLRLAQVRIYGQFFRAFEGTPVRPGEFTVLWVIALNPGVPQGSLARVLTIKPAHMTKLVARLVADGLVRRHVPPADRRSIHLTLTPAGQAHLDRHRGTFLDVHAAERVGLTDDEYPELLRLLSKLAFSEDLTCR
jgi:DNA-binding MarR family transcriptional regulator